MSEPSMFDAASFLHASVTEASTRRPALPAGTELVGTVGEVKFRNVKSTDKQTGAEKNSPVIDIPVEIDLTQYPEIQKQQGGIEKLTMTDNLFLDITLQGGLDLAPGKNNKMRKWREATDLNTAGQPFSFPMLQGRRVKIKISHRVATDGSGEIYDQIGSVTKA